LAARQIDGALAAPLPQARKIAVDALEPFRQLGLVAANAADLEIVEHGQLRKHAATLRRVADAAPHHLGGLQAAQIGAVERDAAAIGRHAERGLEWARLAGAVRADERNGLAGLERQPHALRADDRTIGDGQVLNGELAWHSACRDRPRSPPRCAKPPAEARARARALAPSPARGRT